MRGRPREFDRDRVLEKAMIVFWQKGYEAASVQDLIDAMGINRGSLYDTFGDKRSLFLEAVGSYQKRAVDSLSSILGGSGSAGSRIQKALEHAAGLGQAGLCAGCLLTNCAIERGQQDEEVAALVQRGFAGLEGLFVEVLRGSWEAESVRAKPDLTARARFLVTAMQGLVVMGKARVNVVTRRDAIRVAMSVVERP